MKTLIKKFFDNEVLSYLFFGAAATLVYMTTRLLIFALTGQTLFATITANITAVLFAFITMIPLSLSSNAKVGKSDFLNLLWRVLALFC